MFQWLKHTEVLPTKLLSVDQSAHLNALRMWCVNVLILTAIMVIRSTQGMISTHDSNEWCHVCQTIWCLQWWIPISNKVTYRNRQPAVPGLFLPNSPIEKIFVLQGRGRGRGGGAGMWILPKGRWHSDVGFLLLGWICVLVPQAIWYFWYLFWFIMMHY